MTAARGFVVAALVAAGCAGPPPRSPVSGKVAYRGKPLAGAEVLFAHAATGQRGSAVTGPDGRYRLEAAPGPNRVAVALREPDYPDPNPGAPPGAKLPGKILTPYRYSVTSQSGLSAEVGPGEATADFDLGP